MIGPMTSAELSHPGLPQTRLADPRSSQAFYELTTVVALLVGRGKGLEIGPRATWISNRWDFWKPVGWPAWN